MYTATYSFITFCRSEFCSTRCFLSSVYNYNFVFLTWYSLALLRTSEWYLLASAMNGDVSIHHKTCVLAPAVTSYCWFWFAISNNESRVSMITSLCSKLWSLWSKQIQHWDRRIVERGPIRSYTGQVNSHTVLQLGLDPTERLLISGNRFLLRYLLPGADCEVVIYRTLVSIY